MKSQIRTERALAFLAGAILAAAVLILWHVVRAQSAPLCPNVKALEQGLTLPRGAQLPKYVQYNGAVFAGYYMGATQHGCEFNVRLRVVRVR